ncbi:MAG: tRNA (adenosine(37)-N6)-threonylcarbamoyltransferase complex transferase subunit TsaD [Chloroflexota bacterium]|nr:tRNA (adenosine(37)-N6)-threonylcarbamoyltransferase complex transferase subunit TsaD [Chloroflexota bacterium]
MSEKVEGDLTVLGVESSCDETAVAVVRNGREILSNVVASQVELHQKYGGVFPEMASRRHVLNITPTLAEALEGAGVAWEDIDAVAATYGPGLAGALVVGLNFAKGLALARGLPFIGINHLEGHIYSNWLADPNRKDVPQPEFPSVILIVSGGHTELFLMTDHGQYELLGRTLDDAAGEAFDKVARMLGLPYPGGPPIQRTAEKGNPRAFEFPRSTPNEYDFSFSGLKTAVLREVEQFKPDKGEVDERYGPAVVRPLPVANLAASFQQAVVDVLVERVVKATEAFDVKQVLIAGGVAANVPLRNAMQAALAPLKVPVYYPPIALCTDNAAAIAAAAYWRLIHGATSPLSLEVAPSLKLM